MLKTSLKTKSSAFLACGSDYLLFTKLPGFGPCSSGSRFSFISFPLDILQAFLGPSNFLLSIFEF
jgi:hypothetical protein